jgi:broad specificity phosphatase PhoE
MSFRIPRSRYRFHAVSDWFVYTNPSVSNDSLPAIAENFGLEHGRSWKGLVHELRTLNANSGQTKEHFKLVYAARHGEGDHNVAEAKYGTEAWDAHWSLLTGDGQGNVWGPDPSLTQVGQGQAKDAAARWSELLRSSDPPPMPTRFFSSPMVRAAETLELTFDGIAWPSPSSSKEDMLLAPTEERPRILECLREDFRDRHTCDQRSTRSTVEQRWKPLGWHVDTEMDEQDSLFASSYKESREVMAQRLADALSMVWSLSEGHDVIDITSHSGAMQALFRAVGHDDFKPKTGGRFACFCVLCSSIDTPFLLPAFHRHGSHAHQGNRTIAHAS